MTHRQPPTAIVRVDAVIDIACVWSYLTFARLARAARRFRDDGGAVEIAFHPFQVDPAAPSPGEPLVDHLRRSFGPAAEAKQESFAALAARDGLRMNFRGGFHANTFEGHRLIAQAQAQGRGEEMVDRLFRAYHEEGMDISRAATLGDLAAQVGVTFDDSGAEQLRQELARIRRAGVSGEAISGVPVLVFDGGRELHGSQSEESLLDALRRTTTE